MSRWVKTRPARMFDQCPMLPLQHSEFEFVTCANFRFGSLADIREWIGDFRFTPESGHAQSRHRCLLSAISRHWRPKNDLKPRGAVCGLPCLHANEWVQSPSHRETGEKDVGVILVGGDLSDER